MVSDFLAIEPGLQLFNSGAGQHQRIVFQDVIDIGTDGGQHVQTDQVGRSLLEIVVHGIAIDEQRLLAQAELAELSGQRLRLGFAEIQRFHADQALAGALRGQSHLQAERADLLVERRVEVTDAGTVSLTTADEDRSTTIAVTSGTAALLTTELLAGARNIAALAGSTGSD